MDPLFFFFVRVSWTKIFLGGGEGRLTYDLFFRHSISPRVTQDVMNALGMTKDNTVISYTQKKYAKFFVAHLFSPTFAFPIILYHYPLFFFMFC